VLGEDGEEVEEDEDEEGIATQVSDWSDGSDRAGDGSDFDFETLGAPRAPAKPSRKAKAAKKAPTGGKEEEEEGMQLSEAQIRTVERELGLDVKKGASVEERRAAAQEAVREVADMLRKAGHGNIGKTAADRQKMQLAYRIISKAGIAVKGFSGSGSGEWLRAWLRTTGEAHEAEFASTTSGRGWLVGLLAAKTRKAAAGGSMIGSKGATSSGRQLRAKQDLGAALKALIKADLSFAVWTVIDLERALYWGAVEHQTEAWGGVTEGSLLLRICRFAACFYGERLGLALAVGGCPSSRQNAAHGWYHHCLVRECARAWSAVLEPDPPPGTVAVLKVYIAADGTFEEHSFTDRAGLVDILYRLRRTQSTRGIAPEREDTSRRLAEEQATSLREEQGDRPLMPGACPYELFREVEGVRTLLCDRAGWHSGRMARAIGVNWPPVRATAVQPAETAAEKKAYTAQLEAGVATAEAAVPRGMSNELVLLLGLAARLEHEDPAIVQPQIEAALATLGDARPSFEAVVEASLRRTMHAVRPDVKGGHRSLESQGGMTAAQAKRSPAAAKRVRSQVASDNVRSTGKSIAKEMVAAAQRKDETEQEARFRLAQSSKGTASIEKQGGVLPGDSDAVKKQKKGDAAFGGQGVGSLQQSVRGPSANLARFAKTEESRKAELQDAVANATSTSASGSSTVDYDSIGQAELRGLYAAMRKEMDGGERLPKSAEMRKGGGDNKIKNALRMRDAGKSVDDILACGQV